MSMTKDQILAEAMALKADDRQDLAEDLFQSVETEALTPEQREELRRRAEAIDRGEMALIPADETLRRLRERGRG
jgi:putative addiction module component (TIGR02574 family)